MKSMQFTLPTASQQAQFMAQKKAAGDPREKKTSTVDNIFQAKDDQPILWAAKDRIKMWSYVPKIRKVLNIGIIIVTNPMNMKMKSPVLNNYMLFKFHSEMNVWVQMKHHI